MDRKTCGEKIRPDFAVDSPIQETNLESIDSLGTVYTRRRSRLLVYLNLGRIAPMLILDRFVWLIFQVHLLHPWFSKLFTCTGDALILWFFHVLYGFGPVVCVLPSMRTCCVCAEWVFLRNVGFVFVQPRARVPISVLYTE